MPVNMIQSEEMFSEFPYPSCRSVVNFCLNPSEERRIEEQLEMRVNQHRQKALFYNAVRSNNIKLVKALIANDGVKNLNAPDYNTSSDPALLVAATNLCLPMLRLLLAKGCNPTVCSDKGETVLHRVIRNCRPDKVLTFVEELLNYGCPTRVTSTDVSSPLLLFIHRIADERFKNVYPNYSAIRRTIHLLTRAADFHEQLLVDHEGQNPLHILAGSKIFDKYPLKYKKLMIWSLMKAAPLTNLRNKFGETPLHTSLECGTLETAKLLVPHTVLRIESLDGETPLHIAARKEYNEIAKQLLAYGASPAAQDYNGYTPLHLAAAEGFHRMVHVLMSSGKTDLKLLNFEFKTALDVAADNIIKMIILGINTSKQNLRLSMLEQYICVTYKYYEERYYYKKADPWHTKELTPVEKVLICEQTLSASLVPIVGEFKLNILNSNKIC